MRVKKASQMESIYSQQLENIYRGIAREECLLALQQYADGELEKIRLPFAGVSPNTAVPLEKFGWLRGNEKLFKFHSELENLGFLACTSEEFKPHFKGDTLTFNKLLWLSSDFHLVYVFERFRMEGAIPSLKKLSSLLAQNFLDKNGKNLNEDSLNTAIYRVREGKRNVDLELLITEVLTK